MSQANSVQVTENAVIENVEKNVPKVVVEVAAEVVQPREEVQIRENTDPAKLMPQSE